MTTWQALGLRATAFLSVSTAADSSSLWDRVVGEAPEREQRRPREGFIEKVGSFGSLPLVLRTYGSRIDWFLRAEGDPTEPPDAEPESITMPFPSALQTLLRLTSDWFAGETGVNRIAFGANLIQDAQDESEAKSQLAKYLSHIQIDPIGSTDFFYQINRPRNSKVVPNLQINRLSRWSVVQRLRGEIEISASSRGVDKSFGSVQQSYSAGLELDINTSAAFQSDLPTSELQKLFVELAEFGEELSIDGDVT